jgi:hypothetical protein
LYFRTDAKGQIAPSIRRIAKLKNSCHHLC